MPSLYEQIGQKIRELRTQAGLSQEKLASELGVAANTVSRWETGTYKTTPEDLDKLARYFQVPISCFFPDLEGESARVTALASATGGLDDRDFEEVLRYAEFRRARRVLERAERTKATRGESKKNVKE